VNDAIDIRASQARWWALAAIALVLIAVGLDVTVLSVALPTLAAALRASETDLQWFSSGYALTLAAGMLPAGMLGDRYGRKKVMLAALAIFATGSVACAISPSPAAFIVARAAVGLAGAALVVMALSVITVIFSEAERPRAVGIWAAANFLALPIGPILGGWMLSHAWWGWVFLVNVPVALAGALAVTVLVPESRAANRPRVDAVGIIGVSAGLVALTYGLIEAGQRGWTDAAPVAEMAAGLALLTAFFLWEAHLTRTPGGQPLVDLSLFAVPAFTWGVILAALGVMGMIGVLFTMPQYFQGVLGVDAQASGIRLLPIIVGLVLGAVPADRVAARVGPRLTVTAGLLILALALGLGSTTSLSSSALFVATWMGLAGLGMGLGLATASSAALNAVPADRSGVGSGLMQALQKVGAPFGSAILGSVLVNAYQAQLRLGSLPPAAAALARGSVFGGVAVARALHSPALLVNVREAFVHGMDVALLVSIAFVGLGTILALVFMPGRRGAQAASTRTVAASGPSVA